MFERQALRCKDKFISPQSPEKTVVSDSRRQRSGKMANNLIANFMPYSSLIDLK